MIGIGETIAAATGVTETESPTRIRTGSLAAPSRITIAVGAGTILGG
jgi:hypothetical protein